MYKLLFFYLQSHFLNCKNLKAHYETTTTLYHKSANFTRDEDYSKNGSMKNILVEAQTSYAVNKDTVCFNLKLNKNYPSF